MLSAFRQSSHWLLQVTLASLLSDLIFFVYTMSLVDIIKPVEASSTLIFKAFLPFSFVSRVLCPEIGLAHAAYVTTSARLFFSMVKLISSGYCLEIFLTALENRMNIRDDQCLRSLFSEKAKKLWSYSLQFWISQESVCCSSLEKCNQCLNWKDPPKDLCSKSIWKKICLHFWVLFQIQNWDRLFPRLTGVRR